MEIRTISWKGAQFPLIEVSIFLDTPDERTVWVSTTYLEEMLIKAVTKGDESAIKLDEFLGYYIRESDLDVNEDDLRKEIEQCYNAVQK